MLISWAFTGLLWNPQTTATMALRTVSVSKGTVSESVSASGSVISSASANLNFEASGTLSSVRVAVGDQVEKGDTLAKLDGTQARRQLDAANAQLAAAKDSRDQADSKPDADTKQADSQVAQARVQVGQAEQTVEQNTLSSTIDGTVIAVNGGVGDRVSAGASTTSSGGSSSTSTGSSSGSSSSGSSGSSGSSSGSSGGSSSGSGSSGGSSSGASSSSGSSGGSSGGGASSAGASSAYITIESLHHLQVKAQFAEIDAAKLSAGQQASVTVNALPGKTFTGHVAQVDPTSNSSSSGVVQYGVTIDLDSVPGGMRPGQSSSVQVVVNKAADTLYLPSVAVQGSGSEASVVVLNGAQQVRRTVRLGLRGDQTTQVLSGLADGDKVVLPSASGASTQAQPGLGAGRRGGSGG